MTTEREPPTTATWPSPGLAYPAPVAGEGADLRLYGYLSGLFGDQSFAQQALKEIHARLLHGQGLDRLQQLFLFNAIERLHSDPAALGTIAGSGGGAGKKGMKAMHVARLVRSRVPVGTKPSDEICDAVGTEVHLSPKMVRKCWNDWQARLDWLLPPPDEEIK